LLVLHLNFCISKHTDRLMDGYSVLICRPPGKILWVVCLSGLLPARPPTQQKQLNVKSFFDWEGRHKGYFVISSLKGILISSWYHSPSVAYLHEIHMNYFIYVKSNLRWQFISTFYWSVMLSFKINLHNFRSKTRIQSR